jgi:plastocyanin
MRVGERYTIPVALLLIGGMVLLAGCGHTDVGTTPEAHRAVTPTQASGGPSLTPLPPAPLPTQTTAPSGPQKVTITIDPSPTANGQFDPGQISVPRGSTIIWRNMTNTSHTATTTSGPARFDTGQIPPYGDSIAIVLTTPGTYQYVCVNHSEMTGTIIVT